MTKKKRGAIYMDHIKIVKMNVEKLIESQHSTTEIARLSQISPSSISRIRSRERLLKNLTLESIERLYNCSRSLDI